MSYIDEALPFFLAQTDSICISKHESNSRKEVAFTGAIATNDHIELGRERLDYGLVLVAVKQSVEPAHGILRSLPFEPLYDDLLDVHLDVYLNHVQQISSCTSLRQSNRVETLAAAALRP